MKNTTNRRSGLSSFRYNRILMPKPTPYPRLRRVRADTARSLLLLIIAVAILQSATRSSESHAQGRTNLVLAFYYAWYSPESFGPGKTAFQPEQPYSSSDPTTIERHVNQARGAGIDGFVQSWYGPNEPQTNGNFAALLDIAAGAGFKAAVDFEPGTFFNNNEERAYALTTLLATHANHPAYLRVDGKPVIFFWANWMFSVDDWAYIRSIADPGRNSIWIAEGSNPAYLSVFDGLHLYNIAWAANPTGIASRWASEARSAAETFGTHKYWVGTAMPGFDDRHLGRSDATVYRDRADGAYFQTSFADAATSSPDMLIITSFNEWAEGSNIEPSTAFGSYYLDLARQLISAYKSGSVAVPPPLPAQPTALANQVEPTPGATASPIQSVLPELGVSPTPGADGVIIYQVTAGDTLSGIAVRFGLTVDELLVMNSLTPESLLVIGQEIILGVTAGATRAAAAPQVPPGTTLRDDGAYIYVVVEGDSLLAIAAEYDLRLAELLALNDGLTAESLLTVGQEIVVARRPQPASVGGSTDVRAGVASVTPLPASPTALSPIATRAATATLAPTASREAVAAITVAPPPLATIAPASSTGGAANGASNTLAAVVVIALVSGGLLAFVLARRR
jgi:LysM repeat protein